MITIVSDGDALRRGRDNGDMSIGLVVYMRTVKHNLVFLSVVYRAHAHENRSVFWWKVLSSGP